LPQSERAIESLPAGLMHFYVPRTHKRSPEGVASAARRTLETTGNLCDHSDSDSNNNYPAPGRYRERSIVFARFLCFFVSLSARLRENGWTDLREIFREGVE